MPHRGSAEVPRFIGGGLPNSSVGGDHEWPLLVARHGGDSTFVAVVPRLTVALLLYVSLLEGGDEEGPSHERQVAGSG